jgi:hypothetical protein
MNMAKAPPFAIIFLILGTYLLFEKKFWPLLPLAFIFTLTYDMFVLLLIAVLAWTIVVGWSEERFEWRPLVFVVGGIALGLIINPYFPHNLYLFYEHARMKITVGDFGTKVGQEWYPYDTAEFVVNCYVALAAMLVGYIAFDFSDRKRAQRPLYFLIFATGLLLMNARWKRFAEYFPPFAILFAAFSLESFWQGRAVSLTCQRTCSQTWSLSRPARDGGRRKGKKREQLANAQSRVRRRCFGRSVVRQCLSHLKGHSRSDPRSHAKGALWMRANVPASEMVSILTDVSRGCSITILRMFTLRPDPSYLHEKTRNCRSFVKITTGEQEDPGPLIRDVRARWVFSDNTSDHDSFMIGP